MDQEEVWRLREGIILEKKVLCFRKHLTKQKILVLLNQILANFYPFSKAVILLD